MMGSGGRTSLVSSGGRCRRIGGGTDVDYVCLVCLVSDGLLTCEVEEIVDGGGVTVVGGGGGGGPIPTTLSPSSA